MFRGVRFSASKIYDDMRLQNEENIFQYPSILFSYCIHRIVFYSSWRNEVNNENRPDPLRLLNKQCLKHTEYPS